jgi:hypothetical protein
VNEKVSHDLNLTFGSEDTFILRVENKRVAGPGQGRMSVRIHSTRVYKTHVAV